MQSLSFHLPVFDGPMDLLLHLIAKHKLNIHDIEISILLEQYLLYIQQCAEQDYELAGEFLEMAAKLIWMKTAALLPQAEEAEAVKKELEGALIEYSLCKLTAARLREQYLGDVLFVRKPMKLAVDMKNLRLIREKISNGIMTMCISSQTQVNFIGLQITLITLIIT